jgi:hypothetical protein
MEPLALAAAGVVLLVTVGVGIVAHELSHAAVLYLFGVQCDIAIGPGGECHGRSDSWAVVTPRGLSRETSAWAMRLSSVAPLGLAAPVVLVATGVAGHPGQTDSLLLTAWSIGWLACAIPSPRDFSVFWYADRAVAKRIDRSGER